MKITPDRENKYFISVIRVIPRTSLSKISIKKVEWFSRKGGAYREMALNMEKTLWIEISLVPVRLTNDIYTNFQDKMLLVLKKYRNLPQPKLGKLERVNLLIQWVQQNWHLINHKEYIFKNGQSRGRRARENFQIRTFWNIYLNHFWTSFLLKIYFPYFPGSCIFFLWITSLLFHRKCKCHWDQYFLWDAS